MGDQEENGDSTPSIQTVIEREIPSREKLQGEVPAQNMAPPKQQEDHASTNEAFKSGEAEEGPTSAGGREVKDPIQANEPSDADPDPSPPPQSLSSRIFRTTCALAAYVAVTLNLGMLGPSLLDLELKTQSTTSQISTVFTWRALLGLAASLSMGPVLDKLNRYLLVSIALLSDVILIAAAPWCINVVPLLGLLSPPEFFNSIIGMGTHLICISLWKEKAGPVLQLLNFMATIGYTLAPLLVKPFLSTSLPFSHLGNLSSSQLEWNLNKSLPNYVSGSLQENGSYKSLSTISLPMPLWERVTESNIMYAFLIVAIYALLIGIMLMVFFILDGCHVNLQKHETFEETQEGSKINSKMFIITISIMFFLFNIFYGGIEVGYAGLLMTFAVKYLGWSKDAGTNVTAVLQGSNAVITALAILLSKVMRPNHMLAASIFMVTFSMLVLSFTAVWHYSVLWVCTAGLGIGYATIMPSTYTWVNEFMEVTGKFSSAYWSGFFTGFMLIPALTGYLFQNVSPMWLPYMTCLCGLGMAVMFTTISAFVWYEKKRVQSASV